MDTDTVFLFLPFRLNVRNEQLWHGAQALALRPKTFAVLRYLVARAGQLVTQDELLDAVWGPTVVSETVVRSSIRELRTTLGDTAQRPQFIQTVHRRGYRFIAPVTVADMPQPVLSTAIEPPRGALLPTLPEPDTVTRPSTRPSLDEEHKLVTVLCCAVTDAPALAVHRGPEAMHRLMQTFFALAQEVMHRYDGTITHVTGEGFTAVFGAPVGQEDHARRAVLAALELGQRLRTQPLDAAHAVGMGLHTGPVVVGGLASAPQRLYTAMGDTLHQASRLQRLASPGAIFLSAATHRLVQAEVRAEVADVSALDVQGVPDPVYTVQGLTQRRAGVSGQGTRHRSRFVGRERELALLHERLAHVAQGHGQVVGIAGEPGMGKSRLLAEFHRSLVGQPVTYREGHCLPYSSTTPYVPMRDLLRQGCDLTEADGVEAITTKVRQYLEDAQLMPEDEAPLLLQLLDVPVDDAWLARFSPQERKLRTFALLRHLVLHDSQRQPLILAVENLHWGRLHVRGMAYCARRAPGRGCHPAAGNPPAGVPAALAGAVGCDPDGPPPVTPGGQPDGGAVSTPDHAAPRASAADHCHKSCRQSLLSGRTHLGRERTEPPPGGSGHPGHHSGGAGRAHRSASTRREASPPDCRSHWH